MKQKLNGFLAIAAAGVLSLVLVPQANATVELQLSDGTNTVTVVDGGVLDGCSAANCVTFNGVLGAWSINASTGNAAFGLAPSLDLSTLNKTTVNNAPMLTILTTATNYTPSAIAAEYFGGGTVNKGGTYTFQSFIGNTNAAFDMSNQIGPTEVWSAPTGKNAKSSISFNFDDLSSPIVTSNLYSVTIRSTLVFASGFTGQASSDTTLDLTPTPVPEPAVVSLLGGMLLFTVGAIRRRARRA
jgi:hypothetical protein